MQRAIAPPTKPTEKALLAVNTMRPIGLAIPAARGHAKTETLPKNRVAVLAIARLKIKLETKRQAKRQAGQHARELRRKGLLRKKLELRQRLSVKLVIGRQGRRRLRNAKPEKRLPGKKHLPSVKLETKLGKKPKKKPEKVEFQVVKEARVDIPYRGFLPNPPRGGGCFSWVF